MPTTTIRPRTLLASNRGASTSANEIGSVLNGPGKSIHWLPPSNSERSRAAESPALRAVAAAKLCSPSTCSGTRRITPSRVRREVRAADAETRRALVAAAEHERGARAVRGVRREHETVPGALRGVEEREVGAGVVAAVVEDEVERDRPRAVAQQAVDDQVASSVAVEREAAVRPSSAVASMPTITTPGHGLRSPRIWKRRVDGRELERRARRCRARRRSRRATPSPAIASIAAARPLSARRRPIPT